MFVCLFVCFFFFGGGGGGFDDQPLTKYLNRQKTSVKLKLKDPLSP